MLPSSLHPLWGIETRRGGEFQFATDRRVSVAERRRFVDLLPGRRLAPQRRRRRGGAGLQVGVKFRTRVSAWRAGPTAAHGGT
jgi:hypothetical protein